MPELYSASLLEDARRLLAALERRALLIATAESCTGGLLASLLTEIPGASATVERGFVTYSNGAKSEMLGVSRELMARHGAVSSEVARAMAEGALERSMAQLAVAITGVAGPGGGSAERPVGLVYLAASRTRTATICRECRFGDIGRREVRLAAVKEAIALAREALDRSPP